METAQLLVQVKCFIEHVLAGTQLKFVGALLPLVATVILVIAGSGLTGPSMNPAHAFSWNYFLQVINFGVHLQ